MQYVLVAHLHGLPHSTLTREVATGEVITHDGLPFCTQHQRALQSLQRKNVNETAVNTDSGGGYGLVIIQYDVGAILKQMDIRESLHVALPQSRRHEALCFVGIPSQTRRWLIPQNAIDIALAQDVSPVVVRHPMVDGPLLIEVATDDNGAAKRDDETRQGEGCIALHAGDKSECLFHISFPLILRRV